MAISADRCVRACPVTMPSQTHKIKMARIALRNEYVGFHRICWSLKGWFMLKHRASRGKRVVGEEAAMPTPTHQPLYVADHIGPKCGANRRFNPFPAAIMHGGRHQVMAFRRATI
jgi:hypothetical protein